MQQSETQIKMKNMEMARFVESKHGKLALLDKEGHVLPLKRRHNVKKEICYWICREHRRSGVNCTVKATTNGNKVLNWNGPHNHDVVDGGQVQNSADKKSHIPYWIT